MSLRPEPVGKIPAETARVARAAFPKGTLVTRLRDEFDTLYEDEDFRSLYPARGQPGLTPWRLALVTVFQFLEHLSDRQAADAVRARIDWKYALGLELTDPGFTQRSRPISAPASSRGPSPCGHMLERFKRAASSRPPQAAHRQHYVLLPCAICPFRAGPRHRAALDDLAASRGSAARVAALLVRRDGRRVADSVSPKPEEREALARDVVADEFVLLDAGPGCTAAARELPMGDAADVGGCTPRVSTTDGCGVQRRGAAAGGLTGASPFNPEAPSA